MRRVSDLAGKSQAVFLDRDGTLNDDPGYLDSPEKIRLFPGAIEAVRRINDSGRKVVVVTNQSGVARGLFDEAQLLLIHDHLRDLFRIQGALIDAIYYCPHHPSEGDVKYRIECECRKPNAGLLYLAQRDLNLSLTDSIVIGDRYQDVEMAHRAGARGVLVLTGYGKKEFDEDRESWPQPPDLIANDLSDAIDRILRAQAERFPAEK